jgi:hypothetical protein
MRIVTFTNLGKLGRLGNQLFQIAAVVGTASRNGMDYALPVWKFRDYTKADHTKFGAELNPNLIYHEQDFEYNQIELPSNFNGVLDIFGYFQTEKYFAERSEYIRTMFSPNEEIDYIINDEIKNLGISGGFISLHVRRGDYLSQSHYYSILDNEYYQKAIALLPPNLPILVFSDDENWIRNNFIGDRFIFKPRTNLSFDSDKNDYIDLIMMSKASHFIMANSSYSWWAAWMSESLDKKVIIPSSWFGPGFSGKNTSDIYSKNWIKL